MFINNMDRLIKKLIYLINASMIKYSSIIFNLMNSNNNFIEVLESPECSPLLIKKNNSEDSLCDCYEENNISVPVFGSGNFKLVDENSDTDDCSCDESDALIGSVTDVFPYTNPNGFTYDEYYAELKCDYKDKVSQCLYCSKFYDKSKNGMICFEYDKEAPICYHCIFWMHYSLESRAQVDGVYGKTIVEYILQCYEFHDKNSCLRSKEQNACLICDYLNGVNIENIIGCDVLKNKPIEGDVQVQLDDEDSFSLEIVI